MKLEVGQKLWYVPLRGYPRDVVVLKIGRKWASLDNWERIDIETMYADGRGRTQPGRCYLNQKEWEDDLERTAAYRWLQSELSYGDPRDGVTLEDIRSAAKLLRLHIVGRSQA